MPGITGYHSFWHMFWHSIWHSVGSLLDIYSDTLPGILPDIRSAIPSGILAGTLLIFSGMCVDACPAQACPAGSRARGRFCTCCGLHPLVLTATAKGEDAEEWRKALHVVKTSTPSGQMGNNELPRRYLKDQGQLTLMTLIHGCRKKHVVFHPFLVSPGRWLRQTSTKLSCEHMSISDGPITKKMVSRHIHQAVQNHTLLDLFRWASNWRHGTSSRIDISLS